MQQPWKLASAVVKGADHVRLDLPCQDALQVQVVTHGDQPYLVAAVSDGAGSARLAEVGSRIATEVAIAWLAARAATVTETADPRVLGVELLEAVRVAIAVEAKAQEATLGDLACTLLVALVSDKLSFFAQVGDGAMVVTHGPEAPPYRCVFWPAKGEHANETVFVTSNSAAKHLEATLIRADITEVALFTDGLERLALDFATQTAFPAFFAPFFGAVRALAPGDEASAALSAELHAFLDSPRVHGATSDDRALVLASRQGT